ncbi:hypothetical protein SCLCIDRAFT_637132 [Scleroderma citrinum Foug A]|uniref:Uncharacterized protein n=1 Tax=Scleroderma citrinum Foug A TaxID=1036808 RepID=A0A0C3D501_9AGAM|nr:hypothetical protein SCLCIDRAFT_637132 [Scleroderma citrinum Foug A]
MVSRSECIFQPTERHTLICWAQVSELSVAQSLEGLSDHRVWPARPTCCCAPMEPHAHCARPSYIRSTFEAEIGHSLNLGRLVPHRRQLSRRGAWRLTCGYGGAGQGRKRNGYLYLVGRVIHCVPNLEQQLLLLSLERASPLRPGMTCCPSIRVIPPSLLWAS